MLTRYSFRSIINIKIGDDIPMVKSSITVPQISLRNLYSDMVSLTKIMVSAFIAPIALRWQWNGELAKIKTAMPTAMKSNVTVCGFLN